MGLGPLCIFRGAFGATGLMRCQGIDSQITTRPRPPPNVASSLSAVTAKHAQLASLLMVWTKQYLNLENWPGSNKRRPFGRMFWRLFLYGDQLIREIPFGGTFWQELSKTEHTISLAPKKTTAPQTNWRPLRKNQFGLLARVSLRASITKRSRGFLALANPLQEGFLCPRHPPAFTWPHYFTMIKVTPVQWW